MARCGDRNYMDQLYDIICAIENTKPEPEVCNARCPPLGCPKGSCIGMCCHFGTCDACCVSRMPCCPAPPEPPGCCAPRCIPRMGQPCSNPFPKTASCPMPPRCPSDRRVAVIDQCPTPRCRNSRCGSRGPHRPATCD